MCTHPKALPCGLKLFTSRNSKLVVCMIFLHCFAQKEKLSEEQCERKMSNEFMNTLYTSICLVVVMNRENLKLETWKLKFEIVASLCSQIMSVTQNEYVLANATFHCAFVFFFSVETYHGLHGIHFKVSFKNVNWRIFSLPFFG